LPITCPVKDAGGEASCIGADVSITKQVEMMITKTVETYGRLDGAFNNAGIEGKMADTVAYPEDVFDRGIAINLKGVWLCMKYEIPQMRKSGGGSIVNTASGAGLVGVEQLSAYNASKHGVVGLTKTAALEFAQKNIQVNCVCPGLINTPMVARMIDSGGMNEQEFLAAEPVGRMGRPEEIAKAWSGCSPMRRCSSPVTPCRSTAVMSPGSGGPEKLRPELDRSHLAGGGNPH
jgi:NAD(P)-dependent dehydrogenase (short-subunit alcohol dehydrogenase family)